MTRIYRNFGPRVRTMEYSHSLMVLLRLYHRGNVMGRIPGYNGPDLSCRVISKRNPSMYWDFIVAM